MSDVDEVLSSNIVRNLLICNDTRPYSKSQTKMMQFGSADNGKCDNIYHTHNIRHNKEWSKFLNFSVHFQSVNSL